MAGGAERNDLTHRHLLEGVDRQTLRCLLDQPRRRLCRHRLDRKRQKGTGEKGETVSRASIHFSTSWVAFPPAMPDWLPGGLSRPWPKRRGRSRKPPRCVSAPVLTRSLQMVPSVAQRLVERRARAPDLWMSSFLSTSHALMRGRSHVDLVEADARRLDAGDPGDDRARQPRGGWEEEGRHHPPASADFRCGVKTTWFPSGAGSYRAMCVLTIRARWAGLTRSSKPMRPISAERRGTSMLTSGTLATSAAWARFRCSRLSVCGLPDRRAWASWAEAGRQPGAELHSTNPSSASTARSNAVPRSSASFLTKTPSRALSAPSCSSRTTCMDHPRFARTITQRRGQVLRSCIRPCRAATSPQALMVFADRRPDKWTSS